MTLQQSTYCPKCQKQQQDTEVCQNCGLVFAKHWAVDARQTAQAEPEYSPRKRETIGSRPLFVLGLLVVILIAILAYKLPVQDIYADLIRANKWTYDLRYFRKGQTQDELTALLKLDGFKVKCTEYPGVTKKDAFVCQVLVSHIWGIPANEVNLFFERDKSLTSLLLTFASDQYPMVKNKLGQYGQKSNEDYGKDNEGGQIGAWIIGNGVAISSSAPAPTGIKVYWARQDLMNNNNASVISTNGLSF